MTICAEAAELIRQLRAEVARLHQVVDDYGEHHDNCMDQSCYGGPKCTCGFDAARLRKDAK